MINKIKNYLKERSMKKEQNRQEVWQKIIVEYLDENVDYPDASEVAEFVNLYDIAEAIEIDASEIAYHIDVSDVAYNMVDRIEVYEIASHFDAADLVEGLDMAQLTETVSYNILEDVCSNVEETMTDKNEERVIELFEDNFAAALSDMRDSIIDDVTTEIGMRLADIGECE
jgi:hypothetical protein